jgi:transcriptional regulator with XRE-family HTH domain
MGKTEDLLKEYVLSNYKSLREFSIAIGMPYSTMDSIFKRGIDNSSVTNVIRICKALGISADELAKGFIVSNISKTPINELVVEEEAKKYLADNFDEDEIEAINLLRRLNGRAKTLAVGELRRIVKEYEAAQAAKQITDHLA